MVSNALRVAALLLCLLPCTATAEIIAEGTYRGTYRIDRWQQPRFSFLFVHPRLHDQLKEHAGQPLSVDVTDMRQPFNPGAAMIADVGKIERLDPFVEVGLQWIQPQGDEKLLRRVQPHESLKLRLQITNRSLAELDLSKCEIQLVFHHRAPDADNRLGFRSQNQHIHETFLGKLVDAQGKPSLIPDFLICEAPYLLSGNDERIDVARHRPGDFSLGTSRDAPTLSAGQSVTRSIVIDGLPAN
jgi:hypothetical protein